MVKLRVKVFPTRRQEYVSFSYVGGISEFVLVAYYDSERHNKFDDCTPPDGIYGTTTKIETDAALPIPFFDNQRRNLLYSIMMLLSFF